MNSFVKISFDARETLKDLDSLERDQFPFAYAASLTRLAEGAAASVRVVTKAVFRLHNNFIPSQITITPAKKSDYKRFGFATAEVRTTNRINFMTLQETGEEKKPRRSALAIPDPTREGTGMSLKTKTGAIKPDLRPGYLIAHKKELGVFIRPSDGVLYLRLPEHHLKGLYLMTGAKKIKAKWHFEATVKSFVELKAESFFRQELEIAILGSSIPGKINTKTVKSFLSGIGEGKGVAFG